MVSLETLESLGEWMALGFYQGLSLPWPRPFGLAWRSLYEHMDIRIPHDRYLLPFEPFPTTRTMTGENSWHAMGFICDFNHYAGMVLHEDIATEKKLLFPQYAAQIDALLAELTPQLPYFGGYTHSNPDIRRVVTEGFLAIVAEVEHGLATVSQTGEEADHEELHLLLTLRDYAAGVCAFHHRASAAIRHAAETATGERREKLLVIAESFAHAFLHPARNFVEGLLAVNFTWLLDGCDSLGRLDQALGDLFTRDIENGTLNLTFARHLLDELWQNFERFNGWNIQIGGYTPQGHDGANQLTEECLLACERNKTRRPNVAFRITRETPREIVLTALRVLAHGSGRPALYNDDLYIDTLMALPLGLTWEDARELGFGGCTETMIAGMSNVGSLEGEFHLMKALEYALHDGLDPVTGVQAGPHTGAFAAFSTFAEFLEAVKRQIQYQTDEFVAQNRVALAQRFHVGDPKLARTLFTRDCVKRRKSFEAGGARYNWAVMNYQGIANLIDSLAAIRQCVFTEQTVSREKLLAALAADFAGFSTVQQALRAAPKYGNDNPATDALGREIIGYAWQEVVQHETPRGGRYLPSCILFVTYQAAGRLIGASPDGRHAFTPLTDSIGPVQGRDTHGPTAMLHSVTQLPLSLAVGTPILNMRFQKTLMQSSEGLAAVWALIRTFFDQGGMQIQLSVISKAEMCAAQQHPEDHRDLLVRIGGYSEYFTVLTKELQDSVIARVEYTL